MADPQRGDEFPEDDDGGGESTVSMASPTLDPSGMPSPVSVPPGAAPTAPAPFAPQAPFAMSGKRPGPPQPSVPTPFGGITPAGPPKPLPAAGAPPPPLGGQATGAAAVPAGLKRPQTVIGLAPPPVGSPRPGQAGSRVALPSGGGKPMPPRAGVAPVTPPSSGRGVAGVRPPSSAKPVSPPPSAESDDTNDQLVLPPRESIPDSQKEDFATMAKSPEESLALFGIDSGVSDAARAAVGAKPAPAKPPSGRSPLASTNLAATSKVPPLSMRGGPPPLPPPSSQPQLPAPPPAAAPAPTNELPVLHDRSEEEESTRAVSREEMLRGHDAVVIEDSEAHGEDATLALAPGFNEAAATSAQLAALAQTLTKDAPGPHHHAPMGAPAPPPGFDPNFGQPPPPAPPQSPHAMPAHQGWQQQQHAPMAPPHGWQDPNAYPGQPPSYPNMSVGPVSGPHMPAQSWTPNPPQSQPHFPAAGHPSQSHLPVQQGYPGQQQNLHPAGPAFEPPRRNRPKISGQMILLGIVGVVCLAIFVTGIVLFATTKF